MQTLWSRVAQAQSTCRCRVCLHSTNAVVRRSTTAASRRRVTAADLFTACYTTILGTAVVIDSKRKDVRRKELDDKLEKAKASLSSLAVQEAPALYEPHGAQASTDRPNGTAVDDIPAKSNEDGDLSALLDELADLAREAYAPRTRSPTSRHQVDWTQVEAAISAEEKDPEVFVRTPKDYIHLERTTRTVESLVQDLLWRARSPHSTSQPMDSRSQGDKFLEEAEQLVNEYPSYSNPNLEPEASSDARAYLNETFRVIFNQSTDVREAVGKICYNLLITVTPPNIHNYNTLIAGFNRIRRPDLAQAVIESYLDRTRWPPTQQTLVCILNHASGTNNLDLFRETVARMRGTIEDGMHLRILNKGAIRDQVGLQWVHQFAASRKHSYVQRTHRGQAVFDSLVRGWLHFGMVQAASASFLACVRKQFLIPVDTIHELLSECLATTNRKTARTLLHRLAGDLVMVEALMDHILTEATSEMGRKVAELLCALFDLGGFLYDAVLSDGNKYLNLKHMLESFRKHVSFTDVATDGSSRPLAKVIGLAGKCQSLEEKTKRIEAHAKVLILKHKTGYDLDASNRLPPVDWQHRKRNEHYPALFYALQAIDLASDITTQSDVKAQLLLRLPDPILAARMKAAGNPEGLSFHSLIHFYHPLQKKLGTPGHMSIGIVDQLEARASEIETDIRAILFCQSTGFKQRRFLSLHPDWNSMPLERLFSHHSTRLDNEIRKRRNRTIKPRLFKQLESDEVNEESDGSTGISVEALAWTGKVSPPHGHVELAFPVAKPATTTLPISRRELWSDEQVGLARDQQAEAASC
ncbi:hypothetical protein SUNI508_11925 [Seiridium unicorne]|uniref:Pentatricopeptide repeat domain-containing protein n=1 Tax=Seiridium unicorne TaxID=138068 RepID=A0ABR2UG31_9PEZI